MKILAKIVIFAVSMASIHAWSQTRLPDCDKNKTPSNWNNCIATVKSEDGSAYSGEIKNGQLNGKGVYLMANGDKYEGEFKNDEAYGFGTHYMRNGDVYIGYWKNNKMEGKGIYVYKDGSPSKEGIWQDDKFVKAEKTNLQVGNFIKNTTKPSSNVGVPQLGEPSANPDSKMMEARTNALIVEMLSTSDGQKFYEIGACYEASMRSIKSGNLILQNRVKELLKVVDFDAIKNKARVTLKQYCPNETNCPNFNKAPIGVVAFFSGNGKATQVLAKARIDELSEFQIATCDKYFLKK